MNRRAAEARLEGALDLLIGDRRDGLLSKLHRVSGWLELCAREMDDRRLKNVNPNKNKINT